MLFLMVKEIFLGEWISHLLLHIWVALDNGDPTRESDFRDELYELDAPFEGEGNAIFKSINRLSGIIWGDKNNAIAIDYWVKNRNEKTYLFNPSNVNQEPKIIYDRNYQDR